MPGNLHDLAHWRKFLRILGSSERHKKKISPWCTYSEWSR